VRIFARRGAAPTLVPAETSIPASHVAETALETIDLKKRLKDLDRERLAQLEDDDLVAVINQRRYFADLKAEQKWKKDHAPKRKKLRFLRNQRSR
jgi:hypothetical protein